MQTGIVIQTIAQTGVVLTAFVVGLFWHLEAGAILPAGTNPILYLLQYDWRGVDVQTAETMAFVTLSLCELFRAYTVRSEKVSIFKLGVFSNKYMQYAVALSIFLMIMVVSVTFLQPIFNTHTPDLREWCDIRPCPVLRRKKSSRYLRWRDGVKQVSHLVTKAIPLKIIP
jgi:Ca2+-transporting ATPase